MLIVTSDPSYWKQRGWTIQSCNEKMKDCRTFKRDVKHFPEYTRYSYRHMNASLYQKIKRIKSFLESDL